MLDTRCERGTYSQMGSFSPLDDEFPPVCDASSPADGGDMVYRLNIVMGAFGGRRGNSAAAGETIGAGEGDGAEATGVRGRVAG